MAPASAGRSLAAAERSRATAIARELVVLRRRRACASGGGARWQPRAAVASPCRPPALRARRACVVVGEPVVAVYRRQVGEAWRLVAEVRPWPHLMAARRLAIGFQSSGHQVLLGSEVKGIWLILFDHLRPVW
jgi:hypothetical protein